MPSGQGHGRNGQVRELDGGESGLSRLLKTGQRKRVLEGIGRTQKVLARWTEVTEEQGETTGQKKTSQSSVSMFVR